MLLVRQDVGRLMECRASGQVSMAEFSAFRTDFTNCMGRPKQRVVLLCDVRRLGLIPSDVGQALLRLMRIDSALVERSGYLVSSASPAAMQIDQFIRDASNPARQSFQNVGEALTWLRPVLGPAELARAQAFIAEG